MARVEINTPAPTLTLTDFRGRRVSLSDYAGRKHVLVALNRGFL